MLCGAAGARVQATRPAAAHPAAGAAPSPRKWRQVDKKDQGQQARRTENVLAARQPALELLQVVLPAHGLERVAVVDPGCTRCGKQTGAAGEGREGRSGSQGQHATTRSRLGPPAGARREASAAQADAAQQGSGAARAAAAHPTWTAASARGRAGSGPCCSPCGKQQAGRGVHHMRWCRLQARALKRRPGLAGPRRCAAPPQLAGRARAQTSTGREGGPARTQPSRTSGCPNFGSKCSSAMLGSDQHAHLRLNSIVFTAASMADCVNPSFSSRSSSARMSCSTLGASSSFTPCGTPRDQQSGGGVMKGSCAATHSAGVERACAGCCEPGGRSKGQR